MSSVVEGVVDRFIRGEATDFMSMISDFVIGAVTFGIGDNVARGLKSTGQKLAKASGKKLTNKLPKIELKQLKNTTRKQWETKSKAKFRDLMSAKEVARYDQYWCKVAEKISDERLGREIHFIKNGGILRKNGKIYQPSKVSCAVDLNNGNMYIGYSGKKGMNPLKPPNGLLEPELQKLVDRTKEIAANTPSNPYAHGQSFYTYSIDNCAEIFATNNVLKNGADINNIFLNTEHFWSEEFASLCDNCKITFKNFKTPKNF